LTHFFHLTSAFFGLTSEYKPSLLEEIYICTQHLKGFTYADVLDLPVYERRYFLSLKMKEINEQKEPQEEDRNKQTTKNSKGSRSSTVSGEALKNKMKNGDVPLT
jgi:hypothetical protein